MTWAIEIVPASPEWADRFAERSRTIRGALGSAALRVDHIGSTAVSGLDAKDVVDIQISVADLKVDNYSAALKGLGYAFKPDPDEPEHRFYYNSDRIGAVHIHFCDAGGPWERRHLLFRDYLRAHPERTQAYVDLKRTLADQYRDDVDAYTDGKDAFVAETQALAETWASVADWSLPQHDV